MGSPELASPPAVQPSDTRRFAGTRACAVCARLRVGRGRGIRYLHCSCGHALRFPSCLPALEEMFIFNSQERVSPRLQREHVRPDNSNCSCFTETLLRFSPAAIAEKSVGWVLIREAEHLADGPLGAGENVCVCLTVQKRGGEAS